MLIYFAVSIILLTFAPDLIMSINLINKLAYEKKLSKWIYEF